MARLTLEGDDPYLWLEDLGGADAAGWVRDRNAETVAALTGGEAFASAGRRVGGRAGRRTWRRQPADAGEQRPR
ncbi:hypothetical protein [Micromonospora sp. NPDC002717]|uniref:hypothetical protein n=1 Tax=Micromonospora sp. NPDC002717 TaxID=3154424 RepID=UPI0033269637